MKLGALALLMLFAAWSTATTAPAGGLTVWNAALLGSLQGATEFLPVSSSGHLAIAQHLLGIDPVTAGHRFNITVHAGTLLAVAWVYRRDVRSLLAVVRRPTAPSLDRRLLVMLVVASVPLAVVLVPGVEDFVIRMELNMQAVGIALWATAVVLFVAFRGGRGHADVPAVEPPRPWQAIAIGCAQLVAVLPGISRSGSTIAAGLGVGLDRAAAARFSFLMSLIAIGGASAKEALEILSDVGRPLAPAPFVVGFATSLVVGLASLRMLLWLVARGKVGGFVVYLAILGGLAIFGDVLFEGAPQAASP